MWMLATFAFLGSFLFFWTYKGRDAGAQKSASYADRMLSEHGGIRLDFALNPVQEKALQPVATDLTPEDIITLVENAVRPVGKVVWVSKRFPMEFKATDYISQYTWHIRMELISGCFTYNGSGNGSFIRTMAYNKWMERIRNQARSINRIVLNVWLVILVLSLLLLYFNLRTRWFFELSVVISLFCIGGCVIQSALDNNSIRRGIDDYAWLAFASIGVLCVYHWRHTADRKAGACGCCQYDLTGNVSGQCPECGTFTASSKASQAR